MQKPTLCIWTHAHTITIYAGAYNTPMSIYHYLFSKSFDLLKFLRFQIIENKRLANAIKYVCNPNPRVSTQTPKRGTAMQRAVANTFATAKVLLFFEIYKF